jgi:hypothetical protein
VRQQHTDNKAAAVDNLDMVVTKIIKKQSRKSRKAAL